MPYITHNPDGTKTGYDTQQYDGQPCIPDDSPEAQTIGKMTGQVLVNFEARKFLDQTDWKVLRHRDQLAAGIATSLTNEEYTQLLQQRQESRNKVVE